MFPCRSLSTIKFVKTVRGKLFYVSALIRPSRPLYTYPHFVELVVIDGSGWGRRICPHLGVERQQHAAPVGTPFILSFVHLLGRVALQKLPLATGSVHVHPGWPEGRKVTCDTNRRPMKSGRSEGVHKTGEGRTLDPIIKQITLVLYLYIMTELTPAWYTLACHLDVGRFVNILI